MTTQHADDYNLYMTAGQLSVITLNISADFHLIFTINMKEATSNAVNDSGFKLPFYATI